MIKEYINEIRKMTSTNKPSVLILALIFINIMGMAYAGGGASDTGIQDAGSRIACALCKIASLVFLIVGAVAALVIIMAGLRWTTSGDDPGARQAAKTTIISAFVGIIIVVIAVYIVSVVINGVMGSMMYIDPVNWMSGNCNYNGKCASTGTKI
jgi:hypothetical protein